MSDGPRIENIVNAVDRDYRDAMAFLEDFPEDERDDAARLLYRDARGRLRTRHRLLRLVGPHERADEPFDDFMF